jgi:hypothetical protein
MSICYNKTEITNKVVSVLFIVKNSRQPMKYIPPTKTELDDIIDYEADETTRYKATTETEERKESSPYIQTISSQEPFPKIEKENIPYGIFFAGESEKTQGNQAEKWGFTPQEPWKQIDHYFNKDNPVAVNGWYTKTLRCVFLEIGKAYIEAPRVNGGYDFLGFCWNGKIESDFSKRYKAGEKGLRKRTKTLLLPVSKDNKVLSSKDNILPVAFTLSLGLGACLTTDLKWFYEIFDNLFKDLNKINTKNSYNFSVRNKFVVEVQFSLRKNKGTSNFLAPCKFLLPTYKKSQIGTKGQKIIPASENTTERIIDFEYVNFNDLLIREESETGILISSIYEKHVKDRKQEPEPTTTNIESDFEETDHIPF